MSQLICAKPVGRLGGVLQAGGCKTVESLLRVERVVVHYLLLLLLAVQGSEGECVRLSFRAARIALLSHGQSRQLLLLFLERTRMSAYLGPTCLVWGLLGWRSATYNYDLIVVGPALGTLKSMAIPVLILLVCSQKIL